MRENYNCVFIVFIFIVRMVVFNMNLIVFFFYNRVVEVEEVRIYKNLM